jgi:mitotic spindle assembly checkpoint protein MAD1
MPEQIAMARATNSQPTYDFITGAETTARPPSRGTFGHSTRVSSGGQHAAISTGESEIDYEKRRRELDELKAEVKTLKYTIDNHKQEEELAKLRHESELRDARRKGEEDFKSRQAADADKSKALRQYDALLKEMNEVRDAATNEKASLERRAREIEETKRILEEEVEDIKTERLEDLRILERKSAELESRNEALQRSVEELQQDSDRRETLLQDAQQQLVDKDTSYGALEAENLRLKALTGDADTLGIIKRELSEQVTHIKKLETFNRKQTTELEHYKRLHESVEVVEEEKRSLQRKVNGIESLERELGESRIQRQRLEDERLAWTAYLQSQTSEDGQLAFDSPEALARGFVEERLRSIALVDKVGKVEAALSIKESTNKSLEKEKTSLLVQVEKLKLNGGTSGGNNKLQLRLERQRALAVKEVEYLRAQLKAMDDEDEAFQSEDMEAKKADRVQELEGMIDQYRQEVQTLHGELASREIASPTELAGSKRPREDTVDNEHLGELTRKNRELQHELSTLQASSNLLQKELSVTTERLTAANKQSKTRILSLRSNPTSDFEAIKQTTLTALRQENSDLLTQLQSGTGSQNLKCVPVSTFEAAQRDVKDAEAQLASEKTRNDRLKKIWGAKSLEFRELVISLMGWDVVFMKNGCMKVTSTFYPSKGEEENSIEFNGDRGTMKVSGGPQSKFAMRISEQVKFWVHERGSVPCFLAALTLEFFEEQNPDKTMRIDS